MSFIFQVTLRTRVCLGVVYLYAAVEIRLPCWIKTESWEECCRNLCFAPRVGGTERAEMIFEPKKKWLDVHGKRILVAKQTTGVIGARTSTLFGKLRPRVEQENWGFRVGAAFFLGNVSLRWEPPSLSDLLLSSSERKCYSCTRKTRRERFWHAYFRIHTFNVKNLMTTKQETIVNAGLSYFKCSLVIRPIRFPNAKRV